jgi:hypothetical protein
VRFRCQQWAAFLDRFSRGARTLPMLRIDAPFAETARSRHSARSRGFSSTQLQH